MSLPSIAKEKTSNKVSLVTRPSVTLVQSIQPDGQVIRPGTSKPKLIYVQPFELPPSSTQPAYFTTKLNKPKSLSQPITIAATTSNPRHSNNQIIAVPSTTSSANRLTTFQLKSSNVVTSIPNTQRTSIVSHTTTKPRILLKNRYTTLPTKKVIRRTVSSATTNEQANKEGVTVALSVTEVDPVKIRYQTILENLLQLKNNFVKRTITQAIQQKLANQSTEDLLNVIFKSFELTLLSVNIEQIYLNETYLNATAAFLAKVIDTGRFMELIENRKETKDIKKFITSEMSSILKKIALESVYKSARDIFEQKQRGSYAQILELLIKALSCINMKPDTRLLSTEIEFWLKSIVPLAFDTDDDIQTNAIDALSKALPLLLASRHQSYPQWESVRSDVLGEYTKKINNCFKQGSSKWYLLWCLCVRLLDADIPKSASTLNTFLSIVEPALRSNVPARRAEGYLCWKVLLEVLARHNRLNSEKRLKLVCTPLKSLQAKTVEIATNKFQAWWYVIRNVQCNVDNYISMVFEPFLHFCFGPLFPTPNLRLEPNESATQVKSFPDVSLLAVATFLRILEESDRHVDELFQRYSLDHPTFTILTEMVFSVQTTAALIINACGEATIMLTRLRKNVNNNIDCITLAVCLWTRLFKHVNKTKRIEHINLILDNVTQLLKINLLNSSQTKMIPITCSSILVGHISSSFLFDVNGSDLTEDTIKTIVKYMKTMVQLPNMQSRLNESLSKLLTKSDDVNQFERNFTTFLRQFYEEFIKNSDEQSSGFHTKKLTITYEFIDCILQYIQLNAEHFKEMYSKNVHAMQVFYDILYWPLSLYLHRNEFDDYTKTLLKVVDLLLTVIGKFEFCKGSANVVKNIIANPDHCIYVNDTIAVLFEYMVYDFDDLKDAPLSMLDLCEFVIKKDSKTGFQDLKSITEALIKYRRAIGQQQFEILAPKLREIIRLIDSDKMTVRIEPSLIKDLMEVVGKENKPERNTLSPTTKSLRLSKNNPADFVVVNKVWKLDPSKLTDHQKEKMKTRRCDIPALYNDLSQSQDSASIQGWAPKTITLTTATADNGQSESSEKIVIANDTTESPVESQLLKKIEKVQKTSPKRSSQSQSDVKSERDKDTVDEIAPKRRVIRELNRIQIDAKVDEVPYNNLNESNRLTRSTIKKIETPKEEKSDTVERRKTRSDNVKPTETKDVKKKTTRTSVTTSTVPAKMKNKTNAKVSNSIETEQCSESTPKRRLTRQSRTDDSDPDPDESVQKLDTQTNSIQKEEMKKTELKDTLEVRVEKLPIEMPTKQADKLEDENMNEPNDSNKEIKEETNVRQTEETKQQQTNNESDGTAMEIDDPTTDNADAFEKVDKPEDNKIGVEMNAQVLIETETVSTIIAPNGNDLVKNISLESNNSEPDKELDISSRSYMSALAFDGISPSRSLNGSTIVTSPEIAAPRSIEFLNDTLNISPIVSDTESVEAQEIVKNPDKNKENQVVETIEKPKNDNIVASEKETAVKKINDIDSIKNAVAQRSVAQALESPVVSATKQTKTPLAIQSSTPIQSHHSPVSSKFKPQLMGRGAQLLKMINSNKIAKPASPTPTLMAENAFVSISKTGDAVINQLEQAPIYDHVMSTPDSKVSKEKQNEKNEQNENGSFLTLSGVLPSPFESPGISILKRKNSNISMDDSMHSPAPKRKRVSFGFPLSHTKEYIIDEDFTPFYMIPSNDSPCRRANRLKKLKLKRNKNQNNNAKAIANESKTSQLSDSINVTTHESTSNIKDEEVSVQEIKYYLGMDIEAYRAKQEKQAAADAENATVTPTSINDNNHDLNSDNSSTDSNEDDSEIDATPSAIQQAASTATAISDAKSLAEFSDDAILAHLLSKYTPNDMLKKFESVFDEKVLSKRLSNMMTNDKRIEAIVLEELAEKHSESFLEHAITENLCSVICDRLIIKSPNGITDYTTEKINNDDQFASDFLDRVSVSLLRQKLMDTVATSKREQHILLDDFLAALKEYISSTQRNSPRTVDTGILPEHIHLWVSKLFDQFKLTPEQYLQLTRIFIQRNPPAALDSYD